MSLHGIEALSDEARLWAFGSGRPLSGKEIELLEVKMPPFLEGWTAHRRDLRAGWDQRESRFLLVAVDESRGAAASGCSIDALMRHLAELEAVLDTTLRDGSPVWYRDPGGRLEKVSRDEFRRRASEGLVGPDTPVFDLTLGTLRELRRGGLERPAAESWHARLLPERATAPPGADGDR